MKFNFEELKLSTELQKKIQKKLFKIARPLEIEQYKYMTDKESSNGVLEQLKKYQNREGGFGHGLEPDFHLPDSSPMATSVALQILNKIPQNSSKKAVIRKAINFLLVNYNIDRKGWFSVPESVNKFPHAPWWHWSKKKLNHTVIDNHWGNPSAELIGYLWNHRIPDFRWDIDPLINTAIQYLKKKQIYTSEHEIYCYIRMYHYLPEKFQTQLKPIITTAVDKLVEINPEKWSEYNPQPTHFLIFPLDSMWGLSKDIIKRNLKYIIDEFEERI